MGQTKNQKRAKKRKYHAARAKACRLFAETISFEHISQEYHKLADEHERKAEALCVTANTPTNQSS